MAKKIVLAVFFVIIGGSVLLIKLTKRAPDSIQKKTVFLMDTYCTIQVPGEKEVLARIDKAFDRMKEIDTVFNVLNPQSPLYAFNTNNKAVTDQEIISLIKIALQISTASSGAFDITVYPLMKLWGFYTDEPKLPAQETIHNYLQYTGYRYLSINNGQLTKVQKNTAIDLGGIAKGYAIDQALLVLKQQGISSALIDAGGDIYALGKNYGKPWKVGIKNPHDEGIIGIMHVSDSAIVTSGDYERYFEQGGVRYHHILDPRTGYPARQLMSVTVIAPDAVTADAWATAFFVMGKTEALYIAEKTPGLDVILVTNDEEIIFSSGIKKRFTILEPAERKKQ